LKEDRVMKRNLQGVRLFIIFAAVMAVALATPAFVQSGDAEGTDKSESNAAAALKIIFITTSEGCDCTMARCKKGEEALEKALTLFENVPPVERIDYAKEQDKARELSKKYGVSLLPVFLLLNEKAESLGMLQGEFEDPAVIEILSKHFKKKADK